MPRNTSFRLQSAALATAFNRSMSYFWVAKRRGALMRLFSTERGARNGTARSELPRPVRLSARLLLSDRATEPALLAAARGPRPRSVVATAFVVGRSTPDWSGPAMPMAHGG